ncbi:Lrp/AsnC family transcriptional regulator [Solwaraspora sp. WMMD792]|uniref:Lrp/AsnC family transcriptional regulator n=1 Tax=Solwaraspora sp. WMMD792 TaxID=3016099 RepID=UPI0024160703|nr:Lrp/AsnC family transcriptional regulator [Solwaraspora sp. WMMD792]MDG4769752.1 Lrp/AsnC family transcriptional regulator [Solwaraspora sp. WMMD792]
MAHSPLDELDVAIVDAVRSAPRASWRDLGDVLNVDPATVSRRWARMESEGVAWVTAHPSGPATPACALVEIDCAPGRSTEVARILAEDNQAATVKVTSGARDVLMLAQAPDLDSLSGYLLNLVRGTSGIVRVRSHVVTRSTLEASRWREGALTSEQRSRLDVRTAQRSDDAEVLAAADIRIIRALQSDGRMSFEQLAGHAGVGPVAVRRRLSRLQEAGLITFRCDVSRHLSGRSVSAVYFGSLDVQDLRAAEERIRTLPGVRASTFVAGPFNVIVDASLRSIAEVHDLEWRMGQQLPALRVQDRSVVLNMTKLLGRVLDSEGRSVRSVPLYPDAAATR